MADSDILVTALTASQAGPGAIGVAPVTSGGSCLPYLALAAVEIWGAATNNRANATNLGDTVVGFVHTGLSAGTTRYYWARARDASGNYGDWYPASATAGISATTSTVTPGPNSIGTPELKDDAVTGPKVQDGAVTQTKIANAAIVNAHLGNAIIARANIQNAAVGTANIENLAVTDAKISSIVADKVTAGTLQAGVVYAGIINADQINAGTFTGRTFRTAASGDRRITIDATTHTFEMLTTNGYTRIGFIELAPTLDVNATGGFAAATFTGDASPGQGSVLVRNPMFGNGGTAIAAFSRGEGVNGHGIRAYTTATVSPIGVSAGGQAIMAVSRDSGGHAFLAEKGGYAPFTGVHDAFVAKDELTDVGDIVCDLKVVARNGIDDTVTEVYVAEGEADPAAVGIVSRRVPFEADSLMPAVPGGGTGTRLREILAERYDRLAINSVGEGQVNVCGLGGDIAAGDLIMTSTLRGKGQRQSDGIVRNYTVAKARESVTFASPDDVKRCACIYMCG